MLRQLIEWDQDVFFMINRNYTSDWQDIIMPLVRQPLFWAPLYLFLLAFAWFNFSRQSWWWMLSAGITVTLTDLISSRVFKPMIGRLRPCNNPELSDYVRLLADYCGQNGSFTSSHAANHFGMAMFFFITLEQLAGKYRYLFFLWAILVCYAQIYVGVHFPLDVAGGAVLGMLVGKFVANLFHRKIGIISNHEQ